MKKISLMLLFLAVCLSFLPICEGQIRGWQGTSGSPENFYAEIAKGNIPGHSIIHKFGHANVATTFVPITNSLVYQTPTTAIALEVVSSDADDTSAGAGAQAVTIIGLTLAGVETSQVVELNGLTAVAIPTNLWRLTRWYVSRSGVYGTPLIGSHQGTLTVRVASAGATWSIISFAPYPHGQSQIAWYTVPAGFTAYILTMNVTVDSAKVVDVLALRRENADDVTTPFDTFRLFSEATGVVGIVDLILSKVPVNGFAEFADIGLVAKVAASTADITGHMEILLIADGY